MNCCTGNCNQGRDCDAPALSTRLHRVTPLRTRNGGESVDFDESSDVPPVSADKTAWGAAFFLVAVFVSFVFAGIIGACQMRADQPTQHATKEAK